MQNLVDTHPIAAFLLYIALCFIIGIAIFFCYSTIRKKIQIKRNMKRRVQNDQSR